MPTIPTTNAIDAGTNLTLQAAVDAAERWRQAADEGVDRMWAITSPNWGGNQFVVCVIDGCAERRDEVGSAGELGLTLLRLLRGYR